MTVLSVNVNKVALLRNTRYHGVPSVKKAARMCIDAGAGGITVHPRPDMRHIRPQDVRDLAAMVNVEFNIEGNPFAEAAGDFPGFRPLVREVIPTQCTLVPDTADQFTSDHGWDIQRDGERLRPVIKELQTLGIRVSLFMDTDPEQIRLARSVGADRVELYTGPFADAFDEGKVDSALETYKRAADAAREAGLGINAGHDLNLQNLDTVLSIGGVSEVSIGHALVADALEMGLPQAVQAYLKIINRHNS